MGAEGGEDGCQCRGHGFVAGAEVGHGHASEVCVCEGGLGPVQGDEVGEEVLSGVFWGVGAEGDFDAALDSFVYILDMLAHESSMLWWLCGKG